MKSLKKTLVLLVVLSMLLSAISPVFATNFNDEIDEAYWEHANKLAAVGVITGDTNGNFNATSNITRAEMAVIICKMAGMTEATANASKNIPSVFSDVPAGEWYTGWINLAVDNGMIAGFPDNTFRPNDPLTTNQAITLVVKALGKGEYVDQMGTWPGNYVQEAAKLGLTTEMVDTNSDLANRGNVAILAWEALQVGTWDVTSTTLDGEVRLSAAPSLLIKYFKDFTAGSAKNNDYRVKLVENAVVTRTGKTASDLGENQIVLTVAADLTTKFDGEKAYGDLAEYIDAQNKPNKSYKTATYADGEDVVAYVPAEVASINNLVNKKVDVLFGADNEVALLYVTEDTVDEAYVTKWDEEDKKITIAGETYKVNADAEVLVFNYTVVDAEDAAAIETITSLIETTLGVEKPTKTFNRTLKADIVLDAKDRIEKINFTFSAVVDGVEVAAITTDDGDLTIEEGAVKSVSTSGIVKNLAGGSFFGGNSIEDLMDAEETRVIKDNEVADFDAIEEGDVVTAISLDGTVVLVYVSSEKATGEVASVKNFALTLEDTSYNTILLPLINLDGDFDDAEEVEDRKEVNEFIGEEVEVYLNFLGEVVAVIGNTDATGETVGIVANNATLKTDDEDVEYMSVRILTAEGTKATYKIYNKKSGKDISEAEDTPGFDFADDGLSKGDVVIFSADSNRKIESDEIELPDEDETYTFGSDTDVKVINVTVADMTGNEGDSYIEYNIDEDDTAEKLRFRNASVALNTNPAKIEKINNAWSAIINGEDEFADMDDLMIFYKDSRIVYFVANFASYQSSEEKYAVLTDISFTKNSDGDKVYEATLYVDGEEVTYELDDEDLVDAINENDFVKFTVADDVIDTIETVVFVEDIIDAKDYADISDLVVDALVAPTLKGSIVVDSVEDGWLVFDQEVTAEDGSPVDPLEELDLDEDGYVIYDLRGDEPVMANAVENGDYVIGFEVDADEGAAVLVIVK